MATAPSKVLRAFIQQSEECDRDTPRITEKIILTRYFHFSKTNSQISQRICQHTDIYLSNTAVWNAEVSPHSTLLSVFYD